MDEDRNETEDNLSVIGEFTLALIAVTAFLAGLSLIIAFPLCLIWNFFVPESPAVLWQVWLGVLFVIVFDIVFGD